MMKNLKHYRLPEGFYDCPEFISHRCTEVYMIESLGLASFPTKVKSTQKKFGWILAY